MNQVWCYFLNMWMFSSCGFINLEMCFSGRKLYGEKKKIKWKPHYHVIQKPNNAWALAPKLKY